MIDTMSVEWTLLMTRVVNISTLKEVMWYSGTTLDDLFNDLGTVLRVLSKEEIMQDLQQLVDDGVIDEEERGLVLLKLVSFED